MSQTLDGKRVLLVDDDNDILTSMLAAFEPTGAVVDTASNGNKAVELAEKNLPDLVVLDMMLPGRSGFLVLERIKAKKPRNSKPFVIMITGNHYWLDGIVGVAVAGLALLFDLQVRSFVTRRRRTSLARGAGGAEQLLV